MSWGEQLSARTFSADECLLKALEDPNTTLGDVIADTDSAVRQAEEHMLQEITAEGPDGLEKVDLLGATAAINATAVACKGE
ncbi:hypothetical protein KIPB_005787 [Kipferlia bialata]|uniref:Uncharacterized protein n=1 Tax=Kipferlia bialata TaxID=797122 RepID=A0A391NWC2_9EUKA|nr:hypothetical protein KIPB_005787 [Kipferlia bialata]|eukprot:g5787.t1